MIILSNCLTDTADEGTRKVALNIVRQLKPKLNTTVVTYESRSSLSDKHITINKLMLSRELSALLKSKQEPLLYIPSPAKSLSLAMRLFILSRSAKQGITVILTMPFSVGVLSKWLIKASKARFLTLCDRSSRHYSKVLGVSVPKLNVGVDVDRFQPVSREEKEGLRAEYGIPLDKTVVLHVGHLKPGRNIAQLLKLKEQFHGILVTSTQTAAEQDEDLRRQLLEKENLTLIDHFVPNIQQIYQLSDVYLFPVLQEESCIDSPLSALEAAACGLPVVTTGFGELQSLLREDGFYEIASFEEESLNELLQKAVDEGKNPRNAVLKYDWQNAVQAMLENEIVGKTPV